MHQPVCHIPIYNLLRLLASAPTVITYTASLRLPAPALVPVVAHPDNPVEGTLDLLVAVHLHQVQVLQPSYSPRPDVEIVRPADYYTAYRLAPDSIPAHQLQALTSFAKFRGESKAQGGRGKHLGEGVGTGALAYLKSCMK